MSENKIPSKLSAASALSPAAPDPHPPAPAARPMLGAALKLALPSIAENVLQSGVYFVDALMLASVGEVELAAVSLTGVLIWRLTEVVGCIQLGAAAYISRRWGEGHHVEAGRAASHSLLLAGMLGLLSALIVTPFLPWICRILGAEPDVQSVAVSYSTAVLAAMPFMQMRINLSAALRAAGDTRTPTLASLLVNVLKIALNYCFIFGHCGAPRMGMAGAGLATAISVFFGWAVLLALSVRGLRPGLIFKEAMSLELVVGETEPEIPAMAAAGGAANEGAGKGGAGKSMAGKSVAALDDKSDYKHEKCRTGIPACPDYEHDYEHEHENRPKSGTALPRCRDNGHEHKRATESEKASRDDHAVFRLRKEGLRLYLPGVTGAILRVSRFSLLEELVVTTGFLTFYRMIASFGTLSMAAHAAVVRLESFSYMVGAGLAISASTLVGQSLGRRDAAAATRAFEICALFAASLMGLMGIFYSSIPQIPLGWFSDHKDFLSIAIRLMLITSLEQPLIGAAAVLAGGLRGAGDTLSPTIAQLFGNLGVRIGGGYLLAYTCGLGMEGIYWATVLDWTVRTLVLSLRAAGGKWKKIAL